MGLRPTQGDEKRLLSSNRSPWKRRPPLCHPERCRGICSSADLSWKCFSTERTPDFLLRGTNNGRVCGFLFSIKPPLVFGTAGRATNRRVPDSARRDAVKLHRIIELPAGGESITCTYLAALQPAVEPGHPLLRGAMRKRVRGHVSL
jgi:hypothetical protein